MYKEYKPHPYLCQYIETYWVADGFVLDTEVHRILPDGCVDIIFALNSTSAPRMLPCIPYIVGTMTTFSEIVYHGEIRMLGIRFKPAGITSFIRTPINEFTDISVDTLSFDTILGKKFYDQIQDIQLLEDILHHIDTYLLEQLPYLYIQDRRIEYAVSQIEQSNGNISISDLASKSCMSKRQLERRFISDIGVSPKTYSKIIKFKNAYRFLRLFPQSTLFDVAIDCGYYDHSHLIRDFKRFSGSLPSAL